MGNNRSRMILSVTLAMYVAILSSPVMGAQTANTKAAKAPVAAPAAHDCGNGVTLLLTGSSAQQGGLLELTLASAEPVGEVTATWAGSAVPLWEDGAGLRHALLGVDLDRAPGKYDLSVTGQLASGAQLTCSAQVDVKAGQFAIESLKVAPGFVELSPGDQARADKESQRIHGIFAQVTPERLWAGRFRMPLDGKLTGHNFGKRRVLNGKPMSSPHTGLDIPAPAGTPIHAAQHGRVMLADNLFYSGNTVIIDHGLGVYTFYGHMKSINVAEGDDVNAGAVIGQVGATGRATGPHLHWTLVIDGARVNPLGIVRLGPR